jgi:hypothetical protein
MIGGTDFNLGIDKKMRLSDVVGHRGTNETPDYLYYDCAVANNSFYAEIDSNFSSPGSQPVLANASDYAVAVVRFSIPADSIPIVSAAFVTGTGTWTAGSNIITNVLATSGTNVNNFVSNMAIQNSTPFLTASESFSIGSIQISKYIVPFNGTFTQGSNIISATTLGPLALNLSVGFQVVVNVSGVNPLPSNTFITAINAGAHTVTLSNAATSTITVTGNQIQSYSVNSGNVTLFLNEVVSSFSSANFTAGSYVVTMRSKETNAVSSQIIPTTNPNGTDIITHTEFISFINIACNHAFATVAVGAPVSTNPPFFELNTSGGSDIISYYFDITNTDTDVFLSTNLYELLQGLPAIFLGYYPFLAPSFANYQMLAYDTSGGNGLNVISLTPSGHIYSAVENMTTTLALTFPFDFYYFPLIGQSITGQGIPSSTTITAYSANTATISNAATLTGTYPVTIFSAPYKAYKMAQDSESLWTWSPLQRIVLTTGGIPVSNQILQPSALTSQTTTTGQGINVYRPVLTDFEPLVGTQNYTPYQYYPQGPWRFVSLIGNSPLRLVDIQTSWVDRNGNFIPLVIPPNKKSSILLAFVRKDQLGIFTKA